MEMQQPLISVIVPIYNVEKYVRRCLDSLLHQTMKEIEVICIDDGSTDDSGRIADEYLSDSRFKCYHTKNHGLSEVRNSGIRLASADYIMFVDSDDWVSDHFCQKAYEAAIEQRADIVIFGAYKVKNGKIRQARNWIIPDRPLDEIEAHEFGGAAVWNKLYRRDLFKEIAYPVGRSYEEIATTHKVVHAAGKIVIIPHHLYYHLSREGSISNSHSAQNRKDAFTAALERYEDLVSYGYPEEKIRSFLCGYAIALLLRVQPEDTLYNIAANIVDETKMIPGSLSKKRKIAFALWKTDRRLFAFLKQIVCEKCFTETTVMVRA